MRVIKIDPETRSVEAINSRTTYRAMRDLIGGPMTIAHVFPNEDVLYVDDEGLLKGPDPDTPYFFNIHAHQPFAGRGIIVGREIVNGDERVTDDADLAGDAETNLEYIKMIIKFYSRNELRSELNR